MSCVGESGLAVWCFRVTQHLIPRVLFARAGPCFEFYNSMLRADEHGLIPWGNGQGWIRH